MDPDISPRLATLVLGKIKSLKNDFYYLDKKDDNGKTTTTQEAQEKEPLMPKRRPHVAPSLLMNPTFFNNPRIRETSMPAANGHFSAR